MFGIMISGRPIDATPQQASQTEYAFRIQPNPTFHHIGVFILPGLQLPEGTAATVYVQIPPSTEFKLLGGIGPGKESAIFKVNSVKGTGPTDVDGDVMADDSIGPTDTPNMMGEIVLGVAIEPAASVETKLSTLKTSQSQPSTAMVRLNANPSANVTTKVLAQRIISNAFNFLASFGSDTVPLKAFEGWWKKFEHKIDLDPSFLERDEQG
jgi:protein Hikeshi